jgi:DNA-binding winged helix-turn-helix (wHTH) protein/Tol biopolymer transport system component
MESNIFCCYEFGEFRLDARRRALSKNGEKVPLSARNYDLLLFMVENGGRILEHDELLDKVWVGTFVEQSSLKKGISALRQILAEKPENEFIKTIPRRGYSFVSPVRVVPEDNGVVYVRETEREIIIEEYEETDDENNGFHMTEKVIEIPSNSVKALPSADTKKSSLPRSAMFFGIGLAVIALAFFGLKSYLSKRTEQQFAAENVRVTRLTNNGKVVSGTAVSYDGTYILYPTAEKDGVVLWLRQILANSATKLTPPMKGSFWGFAIAPDNSYVYYIFNDPADQQKSGLFKVPLLGGEPQRIAENVSSLAISPDGKQIVLVRLKDGTNIFTINTNGEGEHAVTTLPDNFRLWSIGWTPDGASLLCTIRKIIENKFLFYIAEISPENGSEKIILPAQEKNIFSAAWLPDKSAMILVVREPNADIRQIWQYFPDSQEWRRVTNDNNSYKLANLSRDGKTIISNQESRLTAIWLSNAALPEKTTSGQKVSLIKRDDFRQITDGISNFNNVGWLADGRLMYAATEDGKETLFTLNSDGSNSRQITTGEDGIWTAPSVTGNGQNVSFLSSRTGIKQVWRVDADGKNPAKLTESEFPVISARVLKDNSSVIYLAQAKSGDTVLFKQTAVGEISQLTDSDTIYWTISPNEKFLAVQLLDKNTGKYHTALLSLEDGKTTKTFDFSPYRQINFTPDGKNLTYDAKSGDVSQIMIQSLDGGEPQPLTDFQSDEIFSFGWSPDGTRLALVRGKLLNDAVIIKANDR